MLVIVLALLVVLTLLAGAVALSGQQAVERTRQEIELFQGELDMLSTRETVLFMHATQIRNMGGLSPDWRPPLTGAILDEDTDGLLMLPAGNEIRLDGTPYAGLGDARFSLQDDRGLISLNWTAPYLRQAYYEHHRVKADQWGPLDAKRLDYQDEDSLHRLNGAEAEHYAKAGKPPPANRPLATPLEFRRIMQWDRMLENTGDEQLLNTLSVAREASINLNTAPAAVIEMLPGMDREQAERMVALRRQTPFVSVYQIERAFPLSPLLNETVILFPNLSGNLILWDRRSGVRHLAHWTLTPMKVGGPPWRIDYEVILPRDNTTPEAVVQAPATPLLASQGAAGE